MPGAWYYLDGAYCVVKTTVIRIYGSQQWCPDAPSVIRSYNIHEWNRLFPGYYCPPGSHCGQPPQTGTQPPAPAAPPATGGSTVTSGAKGMSSGVAGPGEPGKVYTGPKPAPSEPGCAPAMAVVDEELAHGRFSGDGKTGVGNGGFGFSGVDQLAQPLVVGMTPLTVQGDNGRPTYTQEPRFDLRDELGHQTVHAFHEGTADGILCFHPPELIDYMLHGSGTNPNSRWPTNLSQATILLHNCSRADSSTGDVSITRLAFGNPLKGSVLPKSGQYFQYTASTGIMQLVGTNASGSAHKVSHLRVDVALDIPQYSDAEQALLTSHRAGTIVWNTDDEVYQYWDGSAWVDLTTGGGSGDVSAPDGNFSTADALVKVHTGSTKDVKESVEFYAENAGFGASHILRGANASAGTSSKGVTFRSGNGGTDPGNTSGDTIIDVGTGNARGTVKIGADNSGALTIGRSGVTATHNGLSYLAGQTRFSINSPSEITSNQTGYAGTATGTIHRLSSDDSRTINTILAPTGAAGGFAIDINVGSKDIVYLNDDGATGTAADRILTGIGGNYTLGPGLSLIRIYDTTSSRWRILA